MLAKGFKSVDDEVKPSDFNFVLLEESREVILICKRHLISCRSVLEVLEDIYEILDKYNWSVGSLLFKPDIRELKEG